MRIVTVCFDYANRKGMFKRLADVLAVSAKVHTKIPLQTYYIEAPKVIRGRSYHSNTDKLDVWDEIVQDADEDLILMDCDMLFRDCVAEVFDAVTDIGFTVADYDRALPFNGGFMVVKNTKRAKQVMSEWREVNAQMLQKPAFHLPYRQKYAGINQASWGYMLENGLQCDELPMSVYNLSDNWPVSDAKVVHYKSRLRKAIFGQIEHHRLNFWVKEWRKYEALLQT